MSDPRQSARMLRLQAQKHRVIAAHLDLAAAAVTAAAAFQGVFDCLREAVAADVAAHPDLVELDVQMNGFYD